MKYILSALLLFVFTLSSFSQSVENENFDWDHRIAIKTNPLKYLLLNFDLSCEYIINDKRSIEVGINVNDGDFSIIETSPRATNDYSGLYYGGIIRYKLWHRTKSQDTNRRLFKGFYMAPALVLGTAELASPNSGPSTEEYQAFLNSTNTVKYVGGVYDFGISLQSKRTVLEAYLGAGYAYHSDNSHSNQAGLLLRNSVLLRYGFRIGQTF